MRKFFAVIVCIGTVLFVQGCATDRPVGVIFTDSSYDVQALDGNLQGLKMGTAVAESYFGLVGIGDCSINTAAKNGGIKEIKIVDKNCYSVLGYTKITTKVYGTIEQKKDEKK